MILFLKNLLFTLVMPGTVGVAIPLWLANRHPVSTSRTLIVQHIAALPVLALGAAIYFWCLWNFAVRGRATPAPIDAPKVLVVTGPYRYMRNPMYVGVGLCIAGLALWFGSTDVLWYLGAWSLMVQAFVLLYEEPTLRRLFGESYQQYCAAVRRWIPGRPFSASPPADAAP